jgi:ankyrin repeat protein
MTKYHEVLIHFVKENDIQMIKYIIGNSNIRGYINQEDTIGNTALDYATKLNLYSIVYLLIENGAIYFPDFSRATL